MSLSDDDATKVASLIADELTTKKRAQWIDPETHSDHHAWIGDKQKNEQEWKKFRSKVLESSVGWAVPLVLMFICVAMWHELENIIRAALK